MSWPSASQSKCPQPTTHIDMNSCGGEQRCAACFAIYSLPAHLHSLFSSYHIEQALCLFHLNKWVARTHTLTHMLSVPQCSEQSTFSSDEMSANISIKIYVYKHTHSNQCLNTKKNSHACENVYSLSPL
jgi:hypothetical protein